MSLPIQIFHLNNDLNNKKIRICDINETKYASVYDAIEGITGVKNSREVFTNLKVSHPHFLSEIKSFKFGGAGQKETPVAEKAILLEMISLLSGKKAANFRQSGVHALLNVLEPTQKFIETLKDRRYSILDNRESTDLLIPEKNIVVTKLCEETYLYIRIRFPDEYLKTITSKKSLSDQIIKFGITYNLRNRYKKEENDNGYMIYSYQMHSRREAKIVEDILKLKLKDLTVFNSKEYINTIKLAEFLKVKPFNEQSYEEYLHLAKIFFGFMVSHIKRIFNEEYYSKIYGFTYELVEKKSKQRKLTIDGDVTMAETEISSERKDLSKNFFDDIDLCVHCGVNPNKELPIFCNSNSKKNYRSPFVQKYTKDTFRVNRV
ncbi:hypothetical protein HK099_007231, partial [Clydaea vesicula]